jgi:protoporphyrinogen oxidase
MAAKRVLVVGAGYTGLGAAWRLARRGFDVSVLERRDRPAARILSRERDGFSMESLPAVVSTADRSLLAWIGELGLNDDLLPLRPTVSASAHRNRAQPIDPRDWRGIAKIPGVRTRAALRLIRLPRLDARYGDRIDPDRPERAAGLDDRSLADFGRLYFGISAVDHWMAPGVERESLGDARNASRVLFLHRYRSDPEARLGMLRSALGEIAERAAQQLKPEFGVEVSGVESTADGVRLHTATGVHEADAVLFATSATDAARVVDPVLTLAERDSFAKVRYLPSLSLAVALRRPFSPHPENIQFPASEQSPLCSATLEAGIHGGRVPEGHGLALLRARGDWSRAYFDAPDEIVEKELVEAFARVVPRIRGAALFTELMRVREAMPCFEVGRYREIADFVRLQRDQRAEGRRIYFAGDYLMGPGLDAALRAGQRAAGEIDDDLSPR